MDITLKKRHTQLNRTLFHLLCCLLMLFVYPALAISDNHSAVLVCSKDSTINSLNSLDIRRLFLGMNPVSQNQAITPVLNLANKKLYKSFLKNVLHMTEDGYKRKMIKRVFRQGADYIKESKTTDDLIKQLLDNPNEISFISPEQARKHKNIRIVQTLW